MINKVLVNNNIKIISCIIIYYFIKTYIRFIQMHNKSYNGPNGFVEDWSSKKKSHKDFNNKKSEGKKITHEYFKEEGINYKEIKHRESKQKDVKQSESSEKEVKHRESKQRDVKQPESIEKEVKQKDVGFKPVSMILSLQNNLLLNKNNSYNIYFNNGILEGSGININETGNIITFHNEGSYRFEICGEATVFSDVDAKLIYYSKQFVDDIKLFSETKIPRNEGNLQLRGISTILPIENRQTVIVKIVPETDESIMLLGGTRLLIYKVA